MARILLNFDVSSLYPNAIRLFGYSSRNQESADAYVNLLSMRMKAKHGELDDNFLKPLNLTNDDVKGGLKLPLNAYSGALRATFNKLYDPLQGFSICTTGQLAILQLIYDLQQIPTLEMVSANTDAVMFTMEEEYKPQALQVLKDWEDLTGFELEEDKIVKICMRDVNNYCEIVQVGDNDYKVNYKGGEFKGKHKFKWNKEEKKFHYSFDDDIEANSLTIISEALLKNLLFDIPLEETILNCNDIFRFQMITHLGRTYEKCVQESKTGDIELQRNNRIYASKKPSGLIVKVKYDGRRDSLANCPPNPIVDNANECTIDDINKEWYIKVAHQKLSDFKGVKRLTEYKKTELVEMANKMGIEFDPKLKKDELIKLIENNKGKSDNVETPDLSNAKHPSRIKDITGNRYGHLVVLGLNHTTNKTSYWNCKCDCGNIFVREKGGILSNKINSCNKCDLRKREMYHLYGGASSKNSPNHRLYKIWRCMKERCYYIKHKHYNRYGGRGIKVCEEWLSNYNSFKEWALSNGYKDNLTIDRIDNDGNYEPSNCRWITLLEQQKNTSRVVKILYNGEIYTLGDFCKKFHTTRGTVKKYIINQGWTAEKYIEYINNRKKGND